MFIPQTGSTTFADSEFTDSSLQPGRIVEKRKTRVDGSRKARRTGKRRDRAPSDDMKLVVAGEQLVPGLRVIGINDDAVSDRT
jgi:hypothetical protein